MRISNRPAIVSAIRLTYQHLNIEHIILNRFFALPDCYPLRMSKLAQSLQLRPSFPSAQYTGLIATLGILRSWAKSIHRAYNLTLARPCKFYNPAFEMISSTGATLELLEPTGM